MPIKLVVTCPGKKALIVKIHGIQWGSTSVKAHDHTRHSVWIRSTSVNAHDHTRAEHFVTKLEKCKQERFSSASVPSYRHFVKRLARSERGSAEGNTQVARLAWQAGRLARPVDFPAKNVARRDAQMHRTCAFTCWMSRGRWGRVSKLKLSPVWPLRLFRMAVSLLRSNFQSKQARKLPPGKEMMDSVRSESEWLFTLMGFTIYIQDQRRPKGHAPSVWSLRDGPFVGWLFHGLALSWWLTEIDH